MPILIIRLMHSDLFSQVIRYEQEIKQKIQLVDGLILEGAKGEQQARQLSQLIEEEEILMKYLEIESSKMSQEVRTLYAKNIARFKKKIKEHKQYFHAFFGVAPKKQKNFNIRQTLEQEKQNNELFQQKIRMYENERMQANLCNNIQQQGGVILRGIEQNRQIRMQANGASDSISQIQKAILKRKLMFYSIFVLFALAMVFIIIKKLFI